MTEEQALAFVEGHLTPAEIALLDLHLAECSACWALVMEAVHVCEGSRCGAVSGFGPCLALEPGTCIGERYEIRRALGRGGMGEVYEALDRALERVVALKTVRATACDDVEAGRRLAREHALARRVSHPSVCRAYDLGVDAVGAARYITLELVRGDTLARHFRERRLLPGEARELARELWQGLESIHASGVIHRDIKSQNVMLRAGAAGPRLAIIDFGLALERGASAPQLAAAAAGAHGSREGSPPYMAPEQFRPGPLTPAVDLFASGVLLFEALTGTLPFRSWLERPARWKRDPSEPALRVRELAGHVPRDLEALVARCLEADPGRRFAQASAALGALDHLAN